MSLLARLASALEPRAELITHSADLAEVLLSQGLMTDSGVTVTAESAMRVGSVYACVRVLAEDVAKLPLHVYRRLERGKERVTDHWLHELLAVRPNAWQTAYEFREMLQAHLELSGNAYALKTTIRGEVRELLPVVPTRVVVEQFENYRIVYHVTMPDGSQLDVPAEGMLHLRGLSLNGFFGLSPVAYQRETFGVAQQLLAQQARLFRNGAMVGGVLKHPTRMSEDAYHRLKDSFEQQYAGAANAYKTILLEEGAEFTRTGLSMQEAQFIEARKFSRGEIASIYRIPPHKIGDLERATFSNIEHQAIEYVTDSLLPRLRRWESRILASLVPPAERPKLFAEFLVDGLMRGDFEKRHKGYQVAVTTGYLSRNEVRELENLNPAEGLDEFLTPMNMAGDADEEPPPADDPPPAPTPERNA